MRLLELNTLQKDDRIVSTLKLQDEDGTVYRPTVEIKWNCDGLCIDVWDENEEWPPEVVMRIGAMTTWTDWGDFISNEERRDE